MRSKVALTGPIVSVEWLQENMNAENLVIFDCTINKVFDASQEQIPNARLFDIKKKFSNTSDPFPSAFPSEAQFQKEARHLGINNDSTIVVYDDKGKIISSKEWNLLTGVKAIIVFNNEKVVIKEKASKEEKEDEASNN